MISDYLHKKASSNKIPLDGSFELSPVCNFSCKMCYVRRTPEQLKQEGKSIIPWQKWLELAKECREAGTLYLLLTGGEPFIYSGFKELYIQLHQMGFILSINSNGTVIDEETMEWLKQYAPSRVNITLYGSSPETYKRICGNPDGYEKAVKAIKMLHDAGIPVVINASMIPENVCDLESILDFGRKLGINTRMSTYMFPPVRRNREENDSRFTSTEAAEVFLRKQRKLCSSDEYKEFVQKTLKIEEKMAEKDTWGTTTEYMRCRAGRSSFWVSWEGTMTACGMMDFPIQTNPFEEPFQECWIRLTNAVRSTEVLRGCSGCVKREICKPCAAMIYAETGTTDEKAPYLCKMTDCIQTQLTKELEEMKRDEKREN